MCLFISPGQVLYVVPWLQHHMGEPHPSHPRHAATHPSTCGRGPSGGSDVALTCTHSAGPQVPGGLRQRTNFHWVRVFAGKDRLRRHPMW